MLISRLPQLEQGYSLELDSMIFSRHGTQQQRAARGHHPRRPGRLSRHPLLAVLESAKKSGVGIFGATKGVSQQILTNLDGGEISRNGSATTD